MSKITAEQVRKAAEAACNLGFPYFNVKHGESETPPNDITRDLEVATNIAGALPDCFDYVECDTTCNILGTFIFKGYFRTPTVETEVTLEVTRYEASMSSTHLAEFFRLYMRNAPREIPESVKTFDHVVEREG